MSKVKQNYEQLAMALGFQLDQERNVIYGTRNGYQIMLYASDTRYPYWLTASVSAKSARMTIGKQENKQFCKEFKEVTSLLQKEHLITMTVKNISNQNKLRVAIDAALNGLTNFLHINGYEPCCQVCGQQVETINYAVGNAYMHMCQDCISKLRQDTTVAMREKEQKKENVIGGIVGALIGSIIGVICIIFFSQLGRIAAASGVVMAVCTIKGYEMLGGKLTKKGIVISCIMMFVMTYIGDRLDWAIMIVREVGAEWGIDFATAYLCVPDMLADGIIESADYWYNLVLLYVFTLLGAVPTIKSILKERKNEGNMGQIGVNYTL